MEDRATPKKTKTSTIVAPPRRSTAGAAKPRRLETSQKFAALKQSLGIAVRETEPRASRPTASTALAASQALLAKIRRSLASRGGPTPPIEVEMEVDVDVACEESMQTRPTRFIRPRVTTMKENAPPLATLAKGFVGSKGPVGPIGHSGANAVKGSIGPVGIRASRVSQPQVTSVLGIADRTVRGRKISDHFCAPLRIETKRLGQAPSASIRRRPSRGLSLTHPTYSNTFDDSALRCLIESERYYQVDPHAFERGQKHLRWEMRAILTDWLQEVCSDFLFKRETFHCAVNAVDRFLSVENDWPKSELQLLGVSALFLCAKMEEVYTPKLESMVVVADHAYSARQIRSMEKQLFLALDHKISPPTLNLWAQLFAQRWDFFAESAENFKNPVFSGRNVPKFRDPSPESYSLYRELMQLLDASILDLQTLQYKTRALVASFMYVILGKALSQFKLEQIQKEFPLSSLYLLDQGFAFNDLFSRFLECNFSFALEELLPSIQFASTFFHLKINVDFPTAAKIDRETVLEGHFEEFLSYQTHDPSALKFVLKTRNRN